MTIGIHSLPNEPMSLILDQVPDLPTLHALICTSKIWLSLFELKPTELIETVIKRSLPPETQAFPRWVAIIGSLSTPNSIYNPYGFCPVDLESFAQLYDRVHDDTNAYHVPEISPQLGWTAATREVLAAASRIQRLEDICLVALLHNITDMRLSYPNKRNFEFDSHTAPTKVTDEIEFTPTANWAPSWVERQRVRLALWQMMVSWCNHRAFLTEENPIVDLRKGGMRLVLNHTADAYTGLLMGEWLWPAVRGDVFDSVNDVLSCIMGHPPALFFSGILYDASGLDAEIEARDNLDAAYKFTQQVISSNSEWLTSGTKPPNNNNRNNADSTLRQGTQDLGWHNFATGFFVSQYIKSDVGKNLKAEDFRYISILGLSIWDTPRLCALGLAPPPPPPSNSHTAAAAVASPIPLQTLSGYLYVWRSVVVHGFSRLASMNSYMLGMCGLTLPKRAASLLSLSRDKQPLWIKGHMDRQEADDTEAGDPDAEAILVYGIDDREPNVVELEEMDIHKDIVAATVDLLCATTKIQLARMGLNVEDVKVDDLEMDKRNKDGSEEGVLPSDLERLENILQDLREELAASSRASQNSRS